MTGIRVRRATADELDACLALRRIVFVQGQNVPEDLDRDGRDGECLQLIALREDGARTDVIGTARLRAQAGVAKVERVAVLASERRAGIGRALMDEAELNARGWGLRGIVLSAQESATRFYEKLGYVYEGEAFLEAGILHRTMCKTLEPRRGISGE